MTDFRRRVLDKHGEEAARELAQIAAEVHSGQTSIPGSYVRDRYKVPAFLGGTVRFEGKVGQIVDFDGQYLLVRYSDLHTDTVLLHPTWVEYLDADGRQIAHRGEAR